MKRIGETSWEGEKKTNREESFREERGREGRERGQQVVRKGEGEDN